MQISSFISCWSRLERLLQSAEALRCRVCQSLQSATSMIFWPSSWGQGAIKEGPYQDRPPLYPFRLSPRLTCSGSTIAFLKILKIQGPNPKI